MDYSDIIDLPHPDPKYHPRMPIEQRAQQLMPFAALPNYYDKLDEVKQLAVEDPHDDVDLYLQEGVP